MFLECMDLIDVSGSQKDVNFYLSVKYLEKLDVCFFLPEVYQIEFAGPRW